LRVLDHCVRRQRGTIWRRSDLEGTDLQWVVRVLGWHRVQGLAVAGVVALWMAVSNAGKDATVPPRTYPWRSGLPFLGCRLLEHGWEDCQHHNCPKSLQGIAVLPVHQVPAFLFLWTHIRGSRGLDSQSVDGESRSSDRPDREPSRRGRMRSQGLFIPAHDTVAWEGTLGDIASPGWLEGCYPGNGVCEATRHLLGCRSG
jgi:hypothetical protein